MRTPNRDHTALNFGDSEFKVGLFTLMGTILEAQAEQEAASQAVSLALHLYLEH
jgi:hypothetical protein